jgi:hypothetical protein
MECRIGLQTYGSHTLDAGTNATLQVMSECLQAHKVISSDNLRVQKYLEDEKIISLLILRMRYCMDPKTADPSFVNPSDPLYFDFLGEDPFLKGAAALLARVFI